MKRLLILCIATLMFFAAPLAAFAEGESDPTPTPSSTPDGLTATRFWIDDTNIYEGMDKAYQSGYTPKIEDGVATIVLPLLCDGTVQGNAITVTPGLGDASSSPFVIKNYQKTVYVAQNAVNGGSSTVSSYLVRFDLPLSDNRVNGTYPVTIEMQAQGTDGTPIQQSFTTYLTISDGRDPSATEAPTSQPKIIVSSYSTNPSSIEAGEEFTLKVTLKNTSTTMSVQNMTVTAVCSSQNFELQNKSGTFYISSLGKGKTTTITLSYKTDLETPAQRYDINLAISYDNADAQSLSSCGTVTVTVNQPLRMEMEMPTVAQQVYAGDTMPLSFQVMNMGRGMVYNVRVELSAPGLIPSGVAFIGNMEAGTSQITDMNVFVGTRDMSEGHESDEKYGQTYGTVTLIYEDSDGQEYTKEEQIYTTINEPIITASSGEEEEEPGKASQWWVSVMIGGVAIAMLVSWLVIRKKRRVMSYESD